MRKILTFLAVFLVTASAAAGTAHWGGFPEPVGSIADKINNLYNFIFFISVAIMLFVTVWLGAAIWKFRASARKDAEPAKFSHSLTLEIVWTAIPALIVIAIAVKSFMGIMYIRTMPAEGMTVDVISFQFGWEFDYPDLGISSPDPLEPHPQLSSAGTDRYVKDLVVPVDTVVKLNVTARDVIHAFYAPDLGLKVDAMPGRINYLWFRPDQTGDYIGQCAELCGAAHGEMFFNVKVVTRDEYDQWVNERRDFNGLDPLSTEEIQQTLI